MKATFNHPFITGKRILFIFVISIFCLTRAFAQTNPPAGPEVLNNNSIIQLKTAGFSNSIILSKIAATSCNFNTDVNALIQLKNANVDEAVIEAMIKKGAPVTLAATQATTTPVIIPAPVTTSQTQSANFTPDKWGTMIDKETYITLKGDMYTEGQKIRLGSPTGQNHEFKNIIAFDMLGSPEYDRHADQTWADNEVEISKIIAVKGEPKVVYLLFKNTTVKKFGINIEAALLAKEVVQ